jgi:hypothetical protein
MNDMGMDAAAARSSAEGGRSGGSEAVGEPAVAGFGNETLSSWGVCGIIEDGGSTDVLPSSLVRNVMLCITQSINGLYWCNHEYPRMAEAEWSNVVRRK